MDDASLVAELVSLHGAHTIIVYGSRARGDATAESDIDVAAFADVATTTRDARVWMGLSALDQRGRNDREATAWRPIAGKQISRRARPCRLR